MQYVTKTNIQFSGAFLQVNFHTEDSGSGNSYRPSTLEIRADGMSDIIVTNHGSGVRFSFCGQQEFLEFCSSIWGLANALRRQFPDDTGVTTEKVRENVFALEEARHAVKNT